MEMIKQLMRKIIQKERESKSTGLGYIEMYSKNRPSGQVKDNLGVFQ